MTVDLVLVEIDGSSGMIRKLKGIHMETGVGSILNTDWLCKQRALVGQH